MRFGWSFAGSRLLMADLLHNHQLFCHLRFLFILWCINGSVRSHLVLLAALGLEIAHISVCRFPFFKNQIVNLIIVLV
jgi:hypothetical protein